VPPPPEQRLAWLKASLEELPDFLVAPAVFRRLDPPPFANAEDLSLGALLLALDALTASAEDLSPERRADWERARRRWESELVSHRAAVASKAAAELRQRVHVWRAYVQDILEKGNESARHYSSEVRHRVILARLTEVSGRQLESSLDRHLAEADGALRSRFTTGAFVWEAALSRLYPPSAFWFLYGRPEGRG
jgi:hypothetical protein